MSYNDFVGAQTGITTIAELSPVGEELTDAELEQAAGGMMRLIIGTYGDGVCQVDAVIDIY